MKTRTVRATLVPATLAILALGLAAGCSMLQPESKPLPRSAAPPVEAPAPSLAGTSWQLVRFAGADGTRPEDPSRYTIAFRGDGRAALRADCNRGSGTWSSPAPGRLELGPIATTKMGCAPGSQGDRFLRDLGNGGPYRMAGGELEISSGPGGSAVVLAPAGR